jgi:uncharacterized protein
VRIVLDTNVLIAALLSPHGAPAQLLDLSLVGEIVLLVDDRILAEYLEVARHPKFVFPRLTCAACSTRSQRSRSTWLGFHSP